MITLAKGIKKQVLGSVLVSLGGITALLAKIIGFDLDFFYIVISLIGGCLFVYGTIQKKQQSKLAQHELICLAGRRLIISGQRDRQ